MTDIQTSIIIPTHNRRPIVKKSLEALFNQNYPKEAYEIIVIDDGSTDGTKEMIEKLNPTCPFTYLYQEQAGPASARNRGIKKARGEVIIFIDDDIIVTPEFVGSHLKHHQNEKNTIVHGLVIHTNDMDNPTSAELKLQDYSRAFFATGNVSIRKEHLVKAGLFDESFGEYGWEDLELGHRLKRLGLKPVKESEARGYHLKHPFSSKNLDKYISREEQRGRMAIKFFLKDPTFSTRMTTLYWPPFFILEKILNFGGWPDWPVTRKFIRWTEQKGWLGLTRFLTFFVKQKAYFRGLKEGQKLHFNQDAF